MILEKLFLKEEKIRKKVKLIGYLRLGVLSNDFYFMQRDLG